MPPGDAEAKQAGSKRQALSNSNSTTHTTANSHSSNQLQTMVLFLPLCLARPIWNPLVADGILGFDSDSEGVQEDDGTCCMGVRS